MGIDTTTNTTTRSWLSRLLTSFAIIGLCGFAAIRGWSIAQFAEVRARARVASTEGEVNGVSRWIGVPGLTDAALETSLAQNASASDIDGIAKRAEGLAAALSVRPLSSTNWLSLAGIWLVVAHPHQQVLAALQMSAVTGPNEGTIIWQRGIFGVLEWDSLPLDARRRTINDLAGTLLGTSVGDIETSVVRNVLSTKSAETRAQIAHLLKVEGVSASRLASLDL